MHLATIALTLTCIICSNLLSLKSLLTLTVIGTISVYTKLIFIFRTAIQSAIGAFVNICINIGNEDYYNYVCTSLNSSG